MKYELMCSAAYLLQICVKLINRKLCAQNSYLLLGQTAAKFCFSCRADGLLLTRVSEATFSCLGKVHLNTRSEINNHKVDMLCKILAYIVLFTIQNSYIESNQYQKHTLKSCLYIFYSILVT